MTAPRRASSLASLVWALGVAVGCGNEPSTSTNRADLRVVAPGADGDVATTITDLPFGPVGAGQTKKVTLTLRNVGSDLARITQTRFEDAPSGVFFVQAPTEVPADAETPLRLTFSPAAAQPYSARLVLEHSGRTREIVISLSGEGQ